MMAYRPPGGVEGSARLLLAKLGTVIHISILDGLRELGSRGTRGRDCKEVPSITLAERKTSEVHGNAFPTYLYGSL